MCGRTLVLHRAQIFGHVTGYNHISSSIHLETIAGVGALNVHAHDINTLIAETAIYDYAKNSLPPNLDLAIRS